MTDNGIFLLAWLWLNIAVVVGVSFMCGYVLGILSNGDKKKIKKVEAKK